MKKYEIMAIIQNELSETEALEQVKTSITGKVSEFGGKMTFEDFWGSRGFAYKINNKKWGYYFVGQFDAPTDALAKLQRDMNIDTQIVRFLITSVEKNAPAPKKYADMKKENETMEKKDSDAKA